MKITMLVTVVLGCLVILGGPVVAEMTIVDVALSSEVQERDPLGRIGPAPVCNRSEREPTTIPVFDSNGGDALYFWNKVQVASPAMVRHTWYLKKDERWDEAAVVDLPVQGSSGYRTWSSKRISSALHRGEWKIEISDVREPDKVLCTAQFRVE